MTKRLINFRNTQDFAQVENKPTKTTQNKGVQWASCNKGITKVQGVRFIDSTSFSRSQGLAFDPLYTAALFATGKTQNRSPKTISGMTDPSTYSKPNTVYFFKPSKPCKNDEGELTLPAQNKKADEPTFEEFHSAIDKANKKRAEIKRGNKIK